MKQALLARLNNAYTFFQRSTGSLTEKDSSFTPVEGTFSVAGQVAHVDPADQVPPRPTN